MAAVAANGDSGRQDVSTPRPFIVRFYGEEAAPDMELRRLDDILNFTDSELEYHHDYIQVLFPLPERSPFNYAAPVIDEVTRDAFAADESLRKNLFTAFRRMADFYAFEVSGDETDPVIIPKQHFRKLAKRSWLMRMNHNHLRITRIIRCLRILGLEAVAQKFLAALEQNAEGVGERSLMYWERAAKRPLHLPPDEPNEDAEGVSWLRDETADDQKTNAKGTEENETPLKDDDDNSAQDQDTARSENSTSISQTVTDAKPAEAEQPAEIVELAATEQPVQKSADEVDK